jgi:plastocyanin
MYAKEGKDTGSQSQSQFEQLPVEKQNADSVTKEDSTENPESSTRASVTINPHAKVFSIRGKNYEYDLKEIRVKQGDVVTVNFMSSDGFHDWKLDEFAVATTKVYPNTPTSVTFTADKKGEFEYYCSIGNNRTLGMEGLLIVE